jgi:hypothetical protein
MSSLLMFNRVYRLEIQSVMFGFSTLLCELLPLISFSLVNLPPPPFPVLTYNIYRECGAGGGGC